MKQSKEREHQQGAALITGGAVRLGKAMTLALAKYGFDIALHYHSSRSDAEKTASAVRRYGRRCVVFQSDLTSANPTEFMEEVFTEFPSLNLLVNSASDYIQATLKDTSADIFDSQFALNLRVPFFLTQAFAELCQRGQIINIVDNIVKFNRYHYMAYLLTKTALEKLTQAAAVELAPHIRVNGIAPGFILPVDSKHKEYIREKIFSLPLKLHGEPEHITQTLVHIIENKFMTGQILFVDGGDAVNYVGLHSGMFDESQD